MKRKNIFIVGCLIFLLLLSSTSLAAPPQKTADDGELYLKNYQENLINPAQLLDILRDDSVANPLIIDVRTYEDYNDRRIPGAKWVAYADEMGSKESEQELRSLLDEHIASGGANEIVVYCYTGQSAGLVAGVLGARGFNVKSLRFGFNIGWIGNQEAPASIMGPIEKASGAEGSENGLIYVLNPQGQPPGHEVFSLAPRFDTLDGKTIYIVNIGFGHPLHTVLTDELRDLHPNTEFIPVDKYGTYFQDDPDLWDEIKNKVNSDGSVGAGVIIHTGH